MFSFYTPIHWLHTAGRSGSGAMGASLGSESFIEELRRARDDRGIKGTYMHVCVYVYVYVYMFVSVCHVYMCLCVWGSVCACTSGCMV